MPPSRDQAGVHLTLVIPVYNGARFIAGSLQQAWDWLGRRDFAGELLVVDDGSDDATPTILAEFAAGSAGDPKRQFTLLRNATNRGKGFSIRRAFLHARGPYVVFTDADLTYPVENIALLLAALEDGADFVYGNRMNAGSRYVVAPTFFGKLFTRHVMGRIFNFVLRSAAVPGVQDSQAGLKGFRRAAAVLLAQRVRLARFSFDVELFFVARRQRMRVVDCPVRFIYRKEPTTVRFVQDSLAMIRDILRVRWRGLRGAYERDLPPADLQDLLHGGGVDAVAGVGARRARPLGKSG